MQFGLTHYLRYYTRRYQYEDESVLPIVSRMTGLSGFPDIQ